jgi:hypothetical protein
MNPAPTLHIAMPTPSRALTNDYNACKLIMLEANDPTSPLVVTQEGYAPSDPNFRKRVFYLQRDGMWIDEIAYSTLPHTEAGDIVFERDRDVIEPRKLFFLGCSSVAATHKS